MASLLTTVGATLSHEIQSWRSPPGPPKEIAEPPTVGSGAPQSDQIRFPSDKPMVIVFLRHCGCPFAEKQFRSLTAFSTRNPQIHCIAVTQSPPATTDAWAIACGGEWDVEMISDPERNLYAQWGLGLSSTWQVLGPAQTVEAYKLGVNEGIWGGDIDCGNRWQMGGAFAVDESGWVRWAHVDGAVSDVVDLRGARRALEGARRGGVVA